MPSPVNEKTYAYRHNHRILASSIGQENRESFLALFQTLTGTGLVSYQSGGGGAAYTGAAMAVRSSCNGVAFGNNDNVNRITTIADFVQAASGTAHTWHHLQHTASGIHLMFDLNAVSADFSQSTILMSLTGFGAANGGVNGSLTARPTALDEIHISSSTTVATQWGRTTTSEARLLNVHMSTDGEVIRAFFRSPTGSSVPWALEVEKLKNPDPFLDKPWMGRANSYATSGSTFTNATLYSHGSVVFAGFQNSNPTRAAIALASLGLSTTGLVTSQITGVSSYSLAYDVYPTFAICSTASHVGYRGQRYDCWAVPTSLSDVNTFPLTPTTARTHCVVGDVLIPNDGSNVVLV